MLCICTMLLRVLYAYCIIATRCFRDKAKDFRNYILLNTNTLLRIHSAHYIFICKWQPQPLVWGAELPPLKIQTYQMRIYIKTKSSFLCKIFRGRQWKWSRVCRCPRKGAMGGRAPLKNSNISDFGEILIICIKFSEECKGSGPESLGGPVRELWGAEPP